MTFNYVIFTRLYDPFSDKDNTEPLDAIGFNLPGGGIKLRDRTDYSIDINRIKSTKNNKLSQKMVAT